MRKDRLFTPGPTSVPEEVLLQMAKPVIHHRTEEFIGVAARVFADLKYVFQTQGDVLLLASSGTGAMEAAVVNLLSPGDRMVAVCGGKFGQRWAELGRAHGMDVDAIDVEWGAQLPADALRTHLERTPSVKAVFTTLCETSTGTAFDVEGYARVVSAFPDTVLVVDAVSGLGAVPCRTDEWGIDVVVSGSQKALMLPPGLACMSVSAKAWARVEKTKTSRYYFDLRRYRKALPKNDFPFTMAVSLVQGLASSLAMIRSAGIERVWDEHRKRAEATRQGVVAMGLRLFSSAPSDAVTAVALPDGIDGEALVKMLRKKFGISVAEGQDTLKGRIVRISHLGWQDEFDVLTSLTALGAGLKEFGWPAETGRAVEAASSVLFGTR